MITDLVVENFQSVKSARLKLGRLTVITGPTGSGKSAVLRALRLAAFNRRGTAFIRHGAKVCKAGFGSQDEGWFLAIERAGKSSDCYRLSRFDPDNPEHPPVSLYTKLAGEAPEDILRAHRLAELNFAGQFDRPYLLDASGSEVARTLGELTNVSLVLEAAREAGLRRQRADAGARQAAAEAESLAQQVQQYAQLPAQRQAMARAEQALQRAQAAAERVARLSAGIQSAVAGQRAAADARRRAAAAAPPSLARLDELTARRDRLRDLIAQADTSRASAQQWRTAAAVAADQEADAHQAIHDLLAEAGRCPTCGYPVPR